MVKNKNSKKALNIISSILVMLLILVSTFVLICTIVYYALNNNKEIFGYKYYVIDNDLILAKDKDEIINSNEEVIYISTDPLHYYEISVGTPNEVNNENILAKYSGRINNVGKLLNIFNNPIVYFVCTLLPFIIGFCLCVIKL